DVLVSVIYILVSLSLFIIRMSFFQCRPRRFAFLNRCSAACLVKNVKKSNKFLGLLLSKIRKVKAKTFTYRPYCFWFVFRTGIFRVHLHNQVKVAHSVHSRERARRSSALQSSSLKYSSCLDLDS